MPIYEYECQKCTAVIEVMQAISAKDLKKCTQNGCKGKVKRLISATGFILKGSGWYATDYPSDARKQGWDQEQKQGKPEPANGSGDKSPGVSEAGAAGKAESSPAQDKPVKTPAPKNPYTGGKTKKVKAGK